MPGEEAFGKILAEQVGSQAASQGVAGIFDMAMQPWRNRNQLQQNKKLLEQQLAAQQAMGIFNREQAMQMWHDTNAEAQMKHLKDAGLNPALMYGSSGAGGATASTQAGSVGGSNADPRAGGGYSGMNILMPAQVKLMEAQARNLDADTAKKSGVDTELTSTQTTVLKTENELKKLDLKVNENTLWERINEIVSRSIEQQEKGLIAGVNREIAEQTINDNINKIKQEAINVLIQKQVMEKGIELADAQIQKMSADIVLKGRELDINAFIAEVNANQPELGKIIGSILLSSKEKIDKIMGLGKDYTQPRQIKK